MRVLLILLAFCWSADCFGRDALRQLNWRRQQVGLRPYLPAPELQGAAEQSASEQARRGRMFHGFHRGNRSGVGMHSGHDPQGRRFHTCYAFARISPGTRAAAAVATGRGGTYYTLDISGRRGSGASSNQYMKVPCSRCGKIHK